MIVEIREHDNFHADQEVWFRFAEDGGPEFAIWGLDFIVKSPGDPDRTEEFFEHRTERIAEFITKLEKIEGCGAGEITKENIGNGFAKITVRGYITTIQIRALDDDNNGADFKICLHVAITKMLISALKRFAYTWMSDRSRKREDIDMSAH